jgi:hypothetical protein
MITATYYAGSMLHIRAAFQIFKEMLNNEELQTRQGVEGFVNGDVNGSSVCGEPTDVKTLQDKVSDLQYQVCAGSLAAENSILLHLFSRVYCFPKMLTTAQTGVLEDQAREC